MHVDAIFHDDTGRHVARVRNPEPWQLPAAGDIVTIAADVKGCGIVWQVIQRHFQYYTDREAANDDPEKEVLTLMILLRQVGDTRGD